MGYAKVWFAFDSVRRCVNFGFPITTMVQYEAYVNETIRVFLQQIETYFAGKKGPGGVIDFPTWLHFFTDDAITNVTYGKMNGASGSREGRQRHTCIYV